MKLLVVSIALFLFQGCSMVNSSLKPAPIANTAFIDEVLSEAEDQFVSTESYPFNRAWSRGEVAFAKGAEVYVPPVTTSYAVRTVADTRSYRSEAVQELGIYLHQAVVDELIDYGFTVVECAPAARIIIELALVEVSTTDVVRNVLGTALSAVIPGGGILSAKSSGRTAIEGVVRDAQTGEALFLFADREGGKTAPFSFNDFTPYSHARDAIDDWAEQIVRVSLLNDSISDSFVLTLLPM